MLVYDSVLVIIVLRGSAIIVLVQRSLVIGKG